MKPVGRYSEGRDNNYNLLRFVAALLVLFSHCYPVSLGANAPDPAVRIIGNTLGAVGVHIFFVMSGFLVTKSYCRRNSLFAFVEARFLRIFPALAVAVLFCVFVVGTAFTSLKFSDFISHQETFRFILDNITLHKVRYYLPGVFEDNPYQHAVNGSLWTLPYEVKMYLAVALLGIAGIVRNRIFFNILFVVYLVLFVTVPENLPFSSLVPINLTLAFFSGAFIFINRDRIPLSSWAASAFWVLPLIAYRTPYYDAALHLALTYGVIWFAYVPSGYIRNFNKIGDYSYGIYIYAFPIQQSIAAILKGIEPLEMFPIAFSATLIPAVLSWHLLEKPALRLKGRAAGLLMKKVDGFAIFRRCEVPEEG